MRTYELNLPVYKRGDDLAHQLEQVKGDVAKALTNQAAWYDEAAAMCRKLAEVATANPEITIDADTHMICVSGPEDVLTGLVDSELLSVREWEDEEGDEESE